MPRRSSAPAAIEAPGKPDFMLASAFRAGRGSIAAGVHQGAKAWQTEAWRFYYLVPELRYAANWMANVCSRAVLSAAKTAGGDGTPRPASSAGIQAMREFYGGPEGQSRWLASASLHTFMTGEVYTIGRKIKGEYDWATVGNGEVRVANNRWELRRDDGSGAYDALNEGRDIVLRGWQPSPTDRLQADSSVRSLLGVLGEIVALDMHVKSQTVSRLTGAGLLMLPDTIRIPPPSAAVLVAMGLPPDANPVDIIQTQIGNHLTEEIENPGSGEAQVPMVALMPPDSIDKIRRLTFWSELDGQVMSMRANAIERLANGLDMPAGKAVEGQSGGENHWGRWQTDEASIKAHVEPLLGRICGPVATHYLQLASGDIEDDILVDTTALRLRPDHSKEALELGDRGLLGPKAQRRENGFTEADAPTEEDRKQMLLWAVAKGSPSPEQVAEAQRQLGVDLPVAVDQQPNEQRPTPSLLDHPGNTLPGREAALTAACSAMVWRALERAGNKMRNFVPALRASTAPAQDLYLHGADPTPGRMDQLLEGSWSCVPPILASAADTIGPIDPLAVERGLNAYTRNLISDRAQHDPQMMRAYLRREGV